MIHATIEHTVLSLLLLMIFVVTILFSDLDFHVLSLPNLKLMNFKVEILVSLLIFITYIDCAFADSFITEADYIVDNYLMLLWFVIWLLQPRSDRFSKKLAISFAILIFCQKFAYFYDREQSMNFQLDSLLKHYKDVI